MGKVIFRGFVLTGLILAFPIQAHSFEYRSDLDTILHNSLCSNSSPLEKFSMIEDAQTIVRSLHKDGITRDQLSQWAEAQAHEHQHLGIAYGLCNSKKGWIASTPAPLSFEQFLSNFPQTLPASCRTALQLRQYSPTCTSQTIDSSRKHSPCSKIGWNIAPSFFFPTQQAALGVSCLRDEIGASLWYLLPLGTRELKLLETPYLERFNAKDNLASFLTWINQTRTFYTLPTLTEKNLISLQFPLRLIGPTVTHNLDLQQQVSDLLNSAGYSMLAETRVIAENYRHAAQQLWTSPFHREVLLHKKATMLLERSTKIDKKNRLFVFIIMSRLEE